MKSKKDTGEDYFSKGKPFINSQEQRQSVDFITNYHLDHEDAPDTDISNTNSD